jgi:hypothetical protein
MGSRLTSGAFPNAHCPRQANRDVVAPTIADKGDRLALIAAVIAVRDEAVRDHRSAEQFRGGVLQPVPSIPI